MQVKPKDGHYKEINRVRNSNDFDDASSDRTTGGYFMENSTWEGKREYVIMEKGFIPPPDLPFAPVPGGGGDTKILTHPVPKDVLVKLKELEAKLKKGPFINNVYVDIIIPLDLFAWADALPDSSERIQVHAYYPVTHLRPDTFPVECEGNLETPPGNGPASPLRWCARIGGFLDCDVDSDNTDGYNDKWERTTAEDEMEDLDKIKAPVKNKTILGKSFL